MHQIYKLLIDTYEIQKPIMSNHSDLPPEYVKHLANDLKNFQRDSTLNRILTLINRSTNAVKNNKFLKNPPDDKDFSFPISSLPVHKFRKIENKINHIIASNNLSDDSFDYFGYRWRINDDLTHAEAKYELTEISTGREVMWANPIKPRGYSIYWPIEFSIPDFLDQVEMIMGSKWVPRESECSIEYLYSDGITQSFDTKIDKNKTRLNHSVNLLKGRQLVRMRVLLSRATIYFEPKAGDLDEPSIAAIVSEDDSFKWVTTLFKETSVEYLPDEILRTQLKTRIYKQR